MAAWPPQNVKSVYLFYLRRCDVEAVSTTRWGYSNGCEMMSC